MRFPAVRRAARVAASACLVALAVLAASCGSKNPTAPVLPPLSAVTVTPSLDTLVVGETLQLSATAFDTSAAVVANASFDWTTSDAGVATVSSSGLVTARGEGTALIVAQAGGKRDTSVVAVFFQTGWYAQASNTTQTLNGVFFRPDGRRGWAVGAAGAIVTTTNAGASWASRASNTTFTLNGVWFTSDTEGWAVGNSGTVLRSVDGGVTWARVTSVTASENLTDVCFATRDTGWVVGTNGAILRTFNRGTSWTKLNPSAFTLHSVAFSGTRDGWAVGDNGVILGTHDRGLSWYTIQPSITSQSLRGVQRLSRTMAFAAGQQGVTPANVADPDSSAWVLRNAGAANQLEGLAFPIPAIGYACGFNSAGIILKTLDAGLNWTPQVANSAQGLNDVYFVDALRGWAVGDGGRIIHTARGGD